MGGPENNDNIMGPPYYSTLIIALIVAFIDPFKGTLFLIMKASILKLSGCLLLTGIPAEEYGVPVGVGFRV